MAIFNKNYMLIAVVAGKMCSMPLFTLAAMDKW
jgi:hypothetical protein